LNETQKNPVKMTANFHTHTARCRHARGTDREYVESAIRAGISVLGFSDHSPYYFPDGYYSGHRMRPEETEGYVRSLLSLREEYRDDIAIYIGFEAEYYPKYFDRMLEILSPFPYDYLILGQHYIRNELGGKHVFSDRNEEDLICYVDECIEGLNTGRFFYLAHPDVIRFTGDDTVYEREMRRLCLAAKELHIPLEINLLGIRDGRNYPRALFWKIAGEVGCEVILGCDAHEPESIAREDDLTAAEKLIRNYHLKKIEPSAPVMNIR